MGKIKVIQLKDPSSRLVVNGIGQVDNNNITPFLLERLKLINPAYGDMFHEVEVDEVVPRPKKSEESKPSNKKANADI